MATPKTIEDYIEENPKTIIAKIDGGLLQALINLPGGYDYVIIDTDTDSYCDCSPEGREIITDIKNICLSCGREVCHEDMPDESDNWYFSDNQGHEYGPYGFPNETQAGIYRMKDLNIPGARYTIPYEGKGNWKK